MNLVQPKDILKGAYIYFADIVAQMHSWCGDGDISTWSGNYPADSRVVVRAYVKSRDEALTALAKLKKMCGRE